MVLFSFNDYRLTTEDDGGLSFYIPEGTMPRFPYSGNKASSCIAQVTSHHRSFPAHMHCPFPQRKSGGRKSGSELDMKYAPQRMEYEVSTMKSAGKSGERMKEFAESLRALIRHSQGSGRGRHRCVSGKWLPTWTWWIIMIIACAIALPVVRSAVGK